jgi:hypothetical protein
MGVANVCNLYVGTCLAHHSVLFVARPVSSIHLWVEQLTKFVSINSLFTENDCLTMSASDNRLMEV